jgi:hypothetical protein
MTQLTQGRRGVNIRGDEVRLSYPKGNFMTFRAVRLNLTLLLVALYMLLEAAFMLIRVPPGSVSAVPMAEILILFFFLTVVADINLVAPFFRAAPAIPFVIWWLVGGTQLIIGFGEHGFWAMRDATSLIESLFLWIGFVVAASPGAVTTIIAWFHRILILAVLIALTYPFREFLLSFSPVVTSANLKEIPLFFTYQMTPMTAMVGALRFLIIDKRVLGVRTHWLAGLMIIFVAALWQARAIYLQIFFLLAYVGLTKRGNAMRLFAPFGTAILLFAIIVTLGIPIPGRLSGEVSLSFYFEHFLAILGDKAASDSEAIQGAAGGVGQRFVWWQAIWDHVTSSFSTALFGLGYGISLVGLAKDYYIDPIVREPHNSLVSALGRTGFVGLIAYMWMHAALAITGVRTYLSYKAKGMVGTEQFLYLLGAMFGMFWIVAMAEDAFEKPFIAVPYYFFYGVILNLWYRDAHARKDSESLHAKAKRAPSPFAEATSSNTP